MIKAKPKVKKENSERWLLTYSDLITLLLAFFVLMYAMSNADAEKFKRVAASMQKAFNVGVLNAQTDYAISEEGGPTISNVNQALTEDDFDYVSQEMDKFSTEEGMGDRIGVYMRPDGIAISLSANALFASGRAEIGEPSKKILRKITELTKYRPNDIRVEGHTDNVPPNNPEYPTNWDLSMARALSVVKFFVDEEQLQASRFSAAGYAEFRPIADNTSPEGRSKNRRCEILILFPQQGGGAL